MRNVLWDSPVTKTMGIHLKLISLNTKIGLEHCVHEQYFCNSRELYKKLLPLSGPFSLKTKVKESRFDKVPRE